MSKLSIIKEKILTIFFALSIMSIALGFSYLLGKYFIHNVVKSYPVTKTVYKTVYYPVKVKKIRLQPLSIYTLQAGVFTDLSGAQQFAGELRAKGLRPFITVMPPYKVLLFAAPSREKLEKFKEYAPAEAFIFNDILNEVEVDIRVDKKLWLDFLPQFAKLFSESLDVICENGNAKDSELSSAWLELANNLKKQAREEKTMEEPMSILAEDIVKLADLLKYQRATVQSQGEAAQVLLKIKHDYDGLRQFLAKFD